MHIYKLLPLTSFSTCSCLSHILKALEKHGPVKLIWGLLNIQLVRKERQLKAAANDTYHMVFTGTATELGELAGLIQVSLFQFIFSLCKLNPRVFLLAPFSLSSRLFFLYNEFILSMLCMYIYLINWIYIPLYPAIMYQYISTVYYK